MCAAGLFFLYFFGLTRAGLLGPDEPRYADIGRAMAETNDWITPRLWGEPWFEKPPLLYWMTGIGFKAGLNPDLAPRLPVAFLSIAFLVFFVITLRREFGDSAAFYATTLLATSVGWLAYSHIAVTDLPLSAAFGAAMLILLRNDKRGAVYSGILLGLAILAKGLVPLALFLPAVWFLRRRAKDLTIIFAGAAIVGLPWYVLVTLRNGSAFLDEFFVKQTFGRLASSALGHEQPSWFYLPVLLAAMFPWTPMLALLFQKRIYQDQRIRLLAAWLAWGVIFFSLFLNKLPGYLLPLLPAAAALIGIAIAGQKERSPKMIMLIAACAALLWCIPGIQEMLPQALLHGVSRAGMRLPLAWIVPMLGVMIGCVVLERLGRRTYSMSLIALATTLAVIRLLVEAYPVLDQTYSSRGLWNSHSVTCTSESDRTRRYGLNYYAHRSLPDCN